jgi:hypothetical protein
MLKEATSRGLKSNYMLRLLLMMPALVGKSFAQSCAMCYTTVAGGGQGVIQALKSGIIVLLIPPLVLFTGLMWVILRWKTLHAEPDSQVS